MDDGSGDFDGGGIAMGGYVVVFIDGGAYFCFCDEIEGGMGVLLFGIGEG